MQEILVSSAVLTSFLCLALAAHAGLLVMLLHARLAEGSFAVELALETAECLVNGLAFFHSYFRH